MSIIKGKDFRHYLEYSIEREDEDNETGISKISEVIIKSVRMNDLVEAIYSIMDPRNNLRDPLIHSTFQSLPQNIKKSLGTSMLIYRYCIHRILSHFKVYKDENWDKYTIDDYYSEEISSIIVKKETASKIETSLNHISNLSDNKKLEAMLLLEHGRILPTVKNKLWSISSIKAQDLIFSNKVLLEKCQNSDLSYLKSYNLPRGLCIKEGSKYRVIDGYHRLCPYVNKDKKVLVIFCDPSN